MIGQLRRDVFDYILAVIALKQSSIPVFVINACNASFDPFHSVKMILTKIWISIKAVTITAGLKSSGSYCGVMVTLILNIITDE